MDEREAFELISKIIHDGGFHHAQEALNIIEEALDMEGM